VVDALGASARAVGGLGELIRIGEPARDSSADDRGCGPRGRWGARARAEHRYRAAGAPIAHPTAGGPGAIHPNV